MTYLIIHPNTNITEQSLLEVINKHLEPKLNCLDNILNQPDFCIIEQEEKSKIKIEQIKTLQKKLLFSPYSASHQFGIIKNAHLMTIEAQNALLKTLEESQPKTVLILTVKNESSILETILSRCNRIYPKGTTSAIEETKDFTEQELFLNDPIYDKITKIEKVLTAKTTEEFLQQLLKYLRFKHAQNLCKGENLEREEASIKILAQAIDRANKNVNKRLILEYICFKLDEQYS